jgi:hypothetical protein
VGGDVGETQDERDRLIRLEEKMDSVIQKLDEKRENDSGLEKRVRNLEIKTGIIMTVGAGAWAVILILDGKVFAKLL